MAAARSISLSFQATGLNNYARFHVAHARAASAQKTAPLHGETKLAALRAAVWPAGGPQGKR